MPHNENGFNHLEVMGYDMPGIGPKGEIEDCSIGTQSSPGTVVVTFSTVKGETMLILDPVWAEILSERLAIMAEQARKPDQLLTLVKG